MTEPRCIFPECVSTDRHWHGGFPGGYNNPDDPEGAPIFFTSEPAPGVRDYNGAALRGAGDTPAPPTPEERAEFKRGELRAAADLMHASAHRDDPVRGNTPAQEPLRLDDAHYAPARTHGAHLHDGNDCPEYVVGECVVRAALSGVPVEPRPTNPPLERPNLVAGVPVEPPATPEPPR